MKPIPAIRIILFLLPVLLLTNLSAQTERVIILEVNTTDIENPNVNDFCNFQGQDPQVSNEDYTVEANLGDTIIWRGVSTSSPDHTVEIRAINHQGNRGGRDIFGSNKLSGENGEVRGTIINRTEAGTDYKYKIQFRVYIDGSRKRGTFNIDPKIRVVGQ
jgi:plastocyanin